ncbi:peptidylprolyl isomerase [Thauera sp. CAU 1555]|jgi:peptidyl-prolyl cis-trans isomerase SurA|uniref:Chaperone SurA n=1 Tax=Thauera sedimentorum TaxID=2767595 RepID=A0ABR9B571_9RHOO|nr:peptidylprolyl isomerase [Thauera sedimentorum]MBC9070576.1 peptidylprolyl isomerase [Thauera sedimentorum]MBD8501495.1 peptidylprolyl isomerase [Thauera sedimentorum]
MNRLISRLALALLACTAGMASSLQAAPRVVEVDRIIAVVNNEVITALQLRESLDQAVRRLERQGTELPPREVLERQMLERLILERAQLQLARESAIRVDETMLERAIARIAENNGMTVDGLRDTLTRDGIPWSRFRDEIRTELLLTRLREREVDSRIVVTEAEVDNFIATNPDAFSGREYRLAHILLRAPEGASPEQIDALIARANDVMRRLGGGEDFAAVAASVSDAPDAMNGGELGWRSRDRLPAIFAEAVDALRPGQVAPVMRSAAGLHVLKLLDVRGGDAGADSVEQTRVSHILIRTSEVLSDAEAESRLNGLRERVIHGKADFAELAKAHSADLSAAKGGELGWVYPGDTVPEFERAMDALAPGQVSEPVRSPFGWHLIKVHERRVQDVSEERKRAMARAALRQRKSEDAFEDWVRQLRDSTYVEYRLDQE